MKLDRSTIRRLVLEEITRAREPKRRSLAYYIFEAPAPAAIGDISAAKKEIEDFMQTPLSSAGANPAEKLSPMAKKLVKSGTGDDDKKVKGSATGKGDFIPVLQLKASQNEVGKANSLANVCKGANATWDGIDWGDVDWLVEHMKPGAEVEFKDALLGAITTDGNVVLDGHHRWSQAFMLNPECSVNVVFADAAGLSADETLKAVHLAILAKTDQDKTKSASGGNLFQASDADIVGYFDAPEKWIDPKTGEEADSGVAPYVYAVMKTNNITDPVAGKQAAVDRVKAAIAKCSATVVPGAPPRDAMPQADKKTNPISANGVLKALSRGEINYNEPFIPKGAKLSKRVRVVKKADESVSNGDEMIMERWQKLAGLIKD
jgi:hypothetical protein